jgi:hypothetical protein
MSGICNSYSCGCAREDLVITEEDIEVLASICFGKPYDMFVIFCMHSKFSVFCGMTVLCLIYLFSRFAAYIGVHFAVVDFLLKM